jgi:hypothetical protein
LVNGDYGSSNRMYYIVNLAIFQMWKRINALVHMAGNLEPPGLSANFAHVQI